MPNPDFPDRLQRLLAAFLALFITLASSRTTTTQSLLSPQPVFQFTRNGTWIENLAVRPNGDLLLTTVLPDGTLFLVQNPSSPQPRVLPIFTFPTNATHGITEFSPDTFLVIASNISQSDNPANGVLGTNQVWAVSLHDTSNPPAVTARVKKITDLPDAPRLNGAAAVPNSSVVLLGDSQLGAVFRLDTATGKYTKAFQLPEMAPVPGSNSSDDALGINGMKVPGDGFLYFSNAASRTMYRTAITGDGFPASGSGSNNPVEKIAQITSVPWLDDFDVRASDGSIFLTGSTGNVLLFIQRTGSGYAAPVVAAGALDQLALATCTAAVFGRSSGGRSTAMLFVTTGGGLGGPVNGTVIEPAKVVAVDTSGL
ncbi:hypothetical protein QBC47DRAFT_434133 [Echria macrotheca]|uniref:Uncharacterized protein n=1 Tax=Echria macrotheca TaxID=438768 RepID=A0AAJ0F7J9_9PEZI|nr:hypothetical protein QBC47DRAFT_434133 [Echria macrotheca]